MLFRSHLGAGRAGAAWEDLWIAHRLNQLWSLDQVMVSVMIARMAEMRAGAASLTDVDKGDIHHCMNTAWLFAGVDMPRFLAFKTGEPEAYGAFTRNGTQACGGIFGRPFVSWRDDVAVFMGPRLSGYSAVDVEDQTEVEIRSRRLMLRHLDVYREGAPGFENAYLMLSAPQLGVRHARRLLSLRCPQRTPRGNCWSPVWRRCGRCVWASIWRGASPDRTRTCAMLHCEIGRAHV